MKDNIIDLLEKVLIKVGITKECKNIDKLLETPPSQDMGDYALPCFTFSKELKKSPNEVANILKENISNSGEIEKITVNGPYLNFFVDKTAFAEQIIRKILKKGDKYGSDGSGKGETFLIEHTSINPNATPHVGRSRNAMIGDSLVRITCFLGYKTEVHYYVNDVSKQIAMLVLAGADKLSFDDMLECYIDISQKDKDSPELEQEVFGILRGFESGEKDIIKKFNNITKMCVTGQTKILGKLGIHYDYFDNESKYIEKGRKVLDKLEKTGKLLVDKNSRKYLDLSGTIIEGQMKTPVLVLTRGDGTGLYPLRDMVYTIEKLKKSDNNLVVLGEDHKLYFQQLYEGLKLLGLTSPKVVHYSFIVLSEEGTSKKMSTRKGNVVMLEDFLNEAITKAKKEVEKRGSKGDPKKIGIAAVKYAIIKNANNKIINFNLTKVLSFEGDTGPYLLYTYARANSILKKASSSGDYNIKSISDKELALLKKFQEFSDIVQKAHKTSNPSIIANYSYQLAKMFNEFYYACPVIGNENEGFRVNIIKSFMTVFKTSLSLIGIEVIDEM